MNSVPSFDSTLRRYSIVGTCGSGKTTLGARLAAKLNVPAVDLDALHWEPGWQAAPHDVFDARLQSAIAGEAWVVSGNYSRVREAVWSRAQAVVWLDYPRATVMRRLLVRTLRRVTTGEECCNGNRETWRGTLSRDSILLWAWGVYPRRQRSYSELLCGPEPVHPRVYRFTSPRQTEAWLRGE